MKHLRYLKYVVTHKLFVYQEGRKLGLGRAQLLLHDFQKFFPSEWFPYVEKFYGAEHQENTPEWRKVKDDFDSAWLHHQKFGGKHHWQFWVLHKDDGRTKVLEMPEKYLREMIADWRGAGRAITGSNDAAAWYMKNFANMELGRNTRERVHEELDLDAEDRRLVWRILSEIGDWRNS